MKVGRAGGVASLAEERKSAEYAHLAPQFIIQPVAIETSGAIGQTHPPGHERPPLYTVPPSAAVSSGTTGKYGSNLGSTGNYLIHYF